MYYVYLIESLKDGRYYIGQTNNLEERLKYHNRGNVNIQKIKVPGFSKDINYFQLVLKLCEKKKDLNNLKTEVP